MNPLIDQILDLCDGPEKSQAVAALTTEAELRELVEEYNFNDGLELPRTVALHPKCDLGLALTLFYLGDGLTWLTESEEERYDGEEWNQYCADLSSWILAGNYTSSWYEFQPELTKVQIYKAKKQGVADVFLTPLEPAG